MGHNEAGVWTLPPSAPQIWNVVGPEPCVRPFLVENESFSFSPLLSLAYSAIKHNEIMNLLCRFSSLLFNLIMGAFLLEACVAAAQLYVGCKYLICTK